jgi:hypothetical protein
MKIRRTVFIPTFILIAALVSSCGTLKTRVVRAYPGDSLPEAQLSLITKPGSGFPDIYLYRVDGKPDTARVPGTAPATYTDFGTLGFAVTTLPGEHVLEFYNVHKTPFDKAPLNYQSIAFATVAGKSYVMSRNGNSWKVESESRAVPVEVASPYSSHPHPASPRPCWSSRRATTTSLPTFSGSMG